MEVDILCGVDETNRLGKSLSLEGEALWDLVLQ